MKYLRIKYDTALKDVISTQCFEAVDDERAIDTQVALMWLLASPYDSIDWEICKPLSDDVDETTLFGWDMFAVLEYVDPNTIEVIDYY